MEIPYTVTARRDTGLYNAKIGIWLFLASEVMLFGGLFSGYVFLRAGVREGVDIPWPNGIDVHGKYIWIGFTNTLVLILSSVFVVMAWLQLKLRDYGAYQRYMVGVILCALVFMGFKTVEYNSKLNHHFGVRLVDGTLLDGELGYDEEHDCPGDYLTFAAEEAAFSTEATGILRRPDPYFLEFAEEGAPPIRVRDYEAVEQDRVISGPGDAEVTVTTLQFEEVSEGSEEVSLDEMEGWLTEECSRYRQIAQEHYDKTRTELRKAIREAEAKEFRQKLRDELDSLQPVAIPARVTGIWEEPVTFQFRRNRLQNGNYFESSIPFYRGNSIKGELVDDSFELIVHTVDLQMVRDVEESLAWTYLGEGYRKGFENYQDQVREEFRSWTEKGGVIPADEWLLWRHAHPVEGKAEHGGAKEEGSGEHGAHAEEAVSIPGDQVRFSGSHGPKFGPYYAIYFTMTALHGLHVVGGAIVLGYFLFFGKKIYRRNPEHLANRVEVGGLFWHFVDLIWIFLFPIMYLM